MDNLTKVVRKIANYVHNQSKGLTEDEFKVLDRASGLELVEISYKNRINFNRFLKNADMLIDLYEEQVMHTQINEVKVLKRCLQNPAQVIAKKKPVKPSQQPQRVTPTETVTNIPVPNIEIAEGPAVEFDVNPPVQLGLTIPPQLFTSALLAEKNPSHVSISMQRDALRPAVHISHIGSNINLSKSVPNVLGNVQPDEVPVLGESDLARLGFFDGDQGRKMTRILRQQRESDLAMRPSIENQILPMEEEIQPVQVEEPPNAVQQPITTSEIQVHEPESQLDQQNPASSQTNDSSREPMTQRYESFINAANEMLGRAMRRVRRPQRAERPARESTENEFSLMTLRKEVHPKIKRRQRARPVNPLKYRQGHTSASDFFEDIQFLITNDLPFEDEEQQPIVAQDQNLLIDFGGFDPTTSHHRVLTSTPMNQAQHQKRVNLSPENEQQSSKRLRTFASQMVVQAEIHTAPFEPASNLELTDLQVIPEIPEVVVNENQEVGEITGPQPSIYVPQLLPNISDIPRHASQKIHSKSANNEFLEVPQQISMDRPVPSSKDLSSVQERRKQRQDLLDKLRISANSINYDRLRINSRLRKTPAERSQIPPDEIFQNACENISKQEATRTRNSRVVDNQVPIISHDSDVQDDVDIFKGFKRVMINKEPHIELVSNDGSKKFYYTEHQFGSVLLYMKIRSIMSRERGINPWRMDIKVLFKHLKDFNLEKFVIYQRILHMTHVGALIGKFSDDDKLLEVEIPIMTVEESAEKENLL